MSEKKCKEWYSFYKKRWRYDFTDGLYIIFKEIPSSYSVRGTFVFWNKDTVLLGNEISGSSLEDVQAGIVKLCQKFVEEMVKEEMKKLTDLQRNVCGKTL